MIPISIKVIQYNNPNDLGMFPFCFGGVNLMILKRASGLAHLLLITSEGSSLLAWKEEIVKLDKKQWCKSDVSLRIKMFMAYEYL